MNQFIKKFSFYIITDSKLIGYNRICDDLSEEILQYLPFHDKLKFECISKKFQRTIFTKHRILEIDSNMIRKLKFIPNIESYLKIIPSLNFEGFDKLLMKFENINQIYFRNLNSIYNYRYINRVKKLTNPEFNSLMQHIIENCRNLIHCDLYYQKFYKLVWIKFHKKYEKTLISFYDLYTLKFDELSMLNKFNQIQDWEMNTHYAYNLDNNSLINENILKFKKLKKLKLCYCCLDYPNTHNIHNHSNHFIPKLIQTNPQITSLHLNNAIDFSRQNIETKFIEMDIFLNLNLNEFQGTFSFKDDILNNYDVLMKLSRTFKNLRKLILTIRVQFSSSSDNTLTMKNIMNFFKNLTDLRELNLTFDGITVLFREINCDSFSICKKLQKISIQLSRSNDYFNSRFFTNCNENLTSLREINVKRIKYDSNILPLLSSCKYLTKIHLSCLNMKEYIKCFNEFKKQKPITNIKSIEIILNDYMIPISV